MFTQFFQKHKQVSQKVTKLFIVFVLLLTAGLFFSLPAGEAAAITPFYPFGGRIVSVAVNPVPGGNLVCPVYTIIANISPTNGLPPTFGIFIPSAAPAPTYSYGNLFTPGVAVLGGLEPVLCPAPIPVFPLFLNVPFYLIGTSALPGF